jgi:hypothetical protein
MKEYVKTNPNVIGKELTSELFSPILYVLIAVLIIINVLLIILMRKKEKPYMYYILNITLYTGVLVTYIISNGVISNLEKILVAAKTTLAIRDILNIARMLQTVSVVLYLVRATGFDIKKFDFVKDLQELDISEEDSEEIEVSLELEKNEIIRTIKKNIRNLKYYYDENKFILNIIIALSFGLICSLIYISSNKYDKIYKENKYIQAGTYTLGIKESFITTKDYKNNEITDKEHAIVALKISMSSSTNEKIQTSRTVLSINNIQYNPINKYEEAIIDLGNKYKNEELKEEVTDYILIYEIPISEINSKMYFKYIDKIEHKRGKTTQKTIDFKLEPKKLDEINNQEKEYSLTNEIDLNASLTDYKVTINNYEIKDKYEIKYNACITTNECFDLKEIIKAQPTREKEKIALKLNGKIEYKNSINKISNIYDIIEKFGKIEYKINGNTYEEASDFNQITSTKDTENYYIEIDKEIMNAEEIKLVLTFRNKEYKYILKGDINE